MSIFAGAARAADASAWSEDSKSSMRLIAGSNKSAGKLLLAGIEIKLQPGWHTYWRYPGDSGVPPRFDFSASSNLKSAKVLYPAPQLHKDESGQSLVYQNDVIFPVQVIPEQPGRPVKLKLKLAYAVCEKLCIPAEGQAELSLDVGDSTQGATLQSAEALVPKPATATDVGLTLRRDNSGLKPAVMVDLRKPANQTPQLIVEGPTAESALPIPKPVQGAPSGYQRFAFELDGLPPGAKPTDHLDLIFTLVENDKAFEIRTHLD